MAKLLIESGGEVNAALTSEFSESGYAPLFAAVCEEKLGLLEPLVQAGAEIEARNAVTEGTALHAAASRDCATAIKILLGLGAYIECANRSGETPMHAAAKQGHIKSVRLLVRLGAKVDAEDDFGGTPLMWAATFAHVDVVKLLLSKNADPDHRNKAGNTALDGARENARDSNRYVKRQDEIERLIKEKMKR